MVALAPVTVTGLPSVGLSINLHASVHNGDSLARGREGLIATTVLLIVSTASRRILFRRATSQAGDHSESIVHTPQ